METRNFLLISLLLVVGTIMSKPLYENLILKGSKELFPAGKKIRLYGREDEQSRLLKILSGNHRVIEVVGLTGVGKTTFIKDTAEKINSDRGYCVIYIDVSEHKDVQSLLNHLTNDRRCLSFFTSSIMAVSQLFHFDTDNNLQSWCRSLKPNAVLILDHIEQLMDEIDQTIIEPTSTLSTLSFIIQVSRFSKHKYLMRPVIQLKGLNTSICGIWISFEYSQISVNKGEELCDELGGVPREIEFIAAYATNELTAGNVDDVLDKLKSPEYGKPFQYIESILGTNYKDTELQNRVMYLLYDALSYEHRTCIWLLVDMRANDSFTREVVEKHLKDVNISTDDCLNSLLRHSFLETEVAAQKMFKFRPYVRKFIHWIDEPSHDNTSRIKAKPFFGNYVYNSAKDLILLLKNTKVNSSFQLAVNIGSNRGLINSLLPLLGEKYELKSLFKIALSVIENHYCTPNSIQPTSNGKTLLAFSYLTKALHCPQFHAPALLSTPKPKLVPKEDLCFVKLYNCPAILNMENNDSESAEALGYYNSLLIYAFPGPVPWQFYLADISLMVTLAHHECIQYCKESYCLCGNKMSLEFGLGEFLLRNYHQSSKYFQATVYKLSKDTDPCQTILKIIAIIGIYASNSEHRVIRESESDIKILLNMIEFGDLNITCFLGVIHDLIDPFLSTVNLIESHDFRKRVSETIQKENEMCDKQTTTEEERLDCGPKLRYSVAHGMTALKMKSLQKELKWPEEVTEYASREEWVCSIIRDKSTKCQEDLPLFSKVRSIETNDNYKSLWVMKYFMEEDEFEKLYEKAKSIERFFQKMSI